MCNDLQLQIPNSRSYLYPGCKVKLGRFEDTTWIVMFGWYSYGGNRPVCGWYLTNLDTQQVKPISLPDLDDIYFIMQ